MIKPVPYEFFAPEIGRNRLSSGESHSSLSSRIDCRSRSTVDNRSGLAAGLASLAVQALIAEAELTPKPALVDKRGPGAHSDLSLELMRYSASCLEPWFERIAFISFQRIPSASLRAELGVIGRWAEHSMLLSTHGVNTHRGSIWTLGLLVSAAAMGSSTLQTITEQAGQLACFRDPPTVQHETNGSRVRQRYKVSGARGEAKAGFPHVVDAGLPMLSCTRRQGASETEARLNSLLAIMASLNDTCLLHRGGLVALHTAQAGAAAILAAGGTATTRGWSLLLQLDHDLYALNASPGGSADLLAATLFLDSLPVTDKTNHGSASI
jgi:triphosphoribosyl-dephospho-CoA synthase